MNHPWGFTRTARTQKLVHSFFFSTVFYRVFFFFFLFFFFQNHLVCDQNYIHLLFPITCRTPAWNKLYIGGPLRALGSSDIFKIKGSISLVPWKMLLGLVVKRCKSSGWNNGTWLWMIFENSLRIVSWFTKGPWLLSCCTSLFRLIKLPNISPPWPTCGSLADVWPGLVPPKPGWPCLDTDSATTIVSLPSQPINLGRTCIISLVFSLLASLFHFRSFFRFLHNQRNKESFFDHTAEDLEAFTNAWADKFVNANLRPHLASWLRELEDAYPEKLPKLKACFGKTPFTIMGVTKNYVSLTHTDRDILHFVISWFI